MQKAILSRPELSRRRITNPALTMANPGAQATRIIGQVLEIDSASRLSSEPTANKTHQKDATAYTPGIASSQDADDTDKAYTLLPPTTAVEAARLDVQHGLWAKSLDGSLYISPLDSKKALKVCPISPFPHYVAHPLPFLSLSLSF